MKSQKEISEIKNTLKNGNCIFTVKGIETYQNLNNGEYGYALQHLQVSKDIRYIEEINSIGMGGQMNISKFTAKTIHLYTYSILHNRVNGKINYQDVTIIEIL